MVDRSYGTRVNGPTAKRGGKVQLTLYLSPAVKASLKHLAADLNRSVSSVSEEVLSLAIRREGDLRVRDLIPTVLDNVLARAEREGKA